MPSPSPNDLTRQQLDELDSLLQRMLSLPLSAPPEGGPVAVPAPPMPEVPAEPSGNWRNDAPAAVKAPYLVGDPAPQTVTVPAWGPEALAKLAAPAEPRLFGPATPETGVPPAGTLRGVDAPALPTNFRSLLGLPDDPIPVTEREPEQPVAEPDPVAMGFAARIAAEPPPPPAPREPSSGVPVALWPLYGVNWVLEGALGLFGPLGSAVTWPPVKHLLGLVGVVLLAAAGAWAARGMGWVAFDVPPVEWPPRWASR